MKATFKNMAGRALGVSLALVFAVALGAALITSLAPGLMRAADAAVTNYPPGVAVYAMPIQINGAYDSDVATTVTPVRFKLPFAGRLIGFSAAARTFSGTIAVDFQAAGSSLLSAPVTLSSGVVMDGTITTSAVADEAVLTSVVTLTGASATVNDITILPTFLRR